jgi:sterol desaturase/sphingolipid hydroxylase (fatty acid hydroxylase superfamily)
MPETASTLIAFSIPIFFVMIGVEIVVARAQRRPLYRFQDSVNSLSCGIAQQASGIGAKAWTVGSYVFVYETLRVTELDAGASWVWVLGAIGVDFLYYWFHRASHRVGFLWAGHVVHHQSEEYNLSTALRQSALQGALGAVFYWPLAILGFAPALFFLLSTINTLYQFWIHTRLVGKLGPFELLFNTPSHHRVHHGIDPKYIDKNHGGILIVWDRLFGTFQAEEEEPAFGTVKPLHSWNPVWANAEAWARMTQMARATARFSDKLWTFFAPPEWRPADLGGPVTIPEVDRASRVLYERPSRPGMNGYVAAQLALVSLATFRILTSWSSAPASGTAALVVWTLVALLAWGGLFESKRWAFPLEVARLLATPAVVFLAARDLAWASNATPAATAGVAGLALAMTVWLAVLWRRAPVGEALPEGEPLGDVSPAQ